MIAHTHALNIYIQTHLELVLQVLHLRPVVLPHLLHPSLRQGDPVLEDDDVLLQGAPRDRLREENQPHTTKPTKATNKAEPQATIIAAVCERKTNHTQRISGNHQTMRNKGPPSPRERDKPITHNEISENSQSGPPREKGCEKKTTTHLTKSTKRIKAATLTGD